MLGRRRAAPEHSTAVRVCVFAAAAITIVGLAASGGAFSGLVALICLPLTLLGCYASWLWYSVPGLAFSWHRSEKRTARAGPRASADRSGVHKRWRSQALVAFGLVLATAYLLENLFGPWSPDAFPQGTYIALLLSVTSFDIYSRANCYSALLLMLVGVYASSAVAYDDAILVVVLGYALFAAAVLAFSHQEDARTAGRGEGANVVVSWDQRRVGRPRHVATGPFFPFTLWRWQGSGFAAVAVLVLLGGIGTFILLPPYDGQLPVYPVSNDYKVASSFNGTVLNPALDLIQTTPNTMRSAYFGFAPTLLLGAYGPLNNTIVMRVRSSAVSYWRVQTYGAYTGSSWTTDSAAPTPLERAPDASFAPLVDPRDEDGPDAAGGAPTRQTFTLVQGQANLIPVAYRPIRLSFPEKTIFQRATGDLQADQPLQPGTSYTVVSRTPQTDPALLEAATEGDPSAVAPYLALPALPTLTTNAAAASTIGARTRYDKVLAIIAYLQAHAHYNLSTPALAPGQEGVDALLTTGRGFCEQFATALTVLARANGIPARLVTGFAPGDYNALSRVYTVRANDAHAWTEVYFPGYGWIPFDATPGYGAQPRPTAVSSWALNGVMGRLLPHFSLNGMTGTAAGAGAAVMSALTTTPAPAAALLAAAAVCLLFALVFALKPRRDDARSSGKTADPRRRAVVDAYLAMERTLRRRGFASRRGGETVERHAYVLGLQGPHLACDIASLAALAGRASYSAMETTQDDAVTARQLYRHIKAQARRPHEAPHGASSPSKGLVDKRTSAARLGSTSTND